MEGLALRLGRRRGRGDGLHHVVHGHDVEGRPRAAEVHERLAGAVGPGHRPQEVVGAVELLRLAGPRVAHHDRRAQDGHRQPGEELARPDLGLELGRLVVVLEALAHDQLVLVDDPGAQPRHVGGAHVRQPLEAARRPRTAPARCRCRPRSPAAPAPPAPPGRRWPPGGRPARPRPAGARSRCRTARAGARRCPRPRISIRSGAISAAAARAASSIRGSTSATIVRSESSSKQPPRQPLADEAGEAGEQVDRHGAESMAPAAPRPGLTATAPKLRPRDATRDQVLADGHGRRAGPRGAGDPGRERLPGRPQAQRHPVPGAHQQLHLHAPRPGGAAAHQRARGPGGVDLDLGAGHRAVPGGPAARRVGVRDRRVGPDHRPPRGRLHAQRARPRLRGAGRDAHLQLRADHAGHPAGGQRIALHRHQPRPHRPDPRRARCRPRARWRR